MHLIWSETPSWVVHFYSLIQWVTYSLWFLDWAIYICRGAKARCQKWRVRLFVWERLRKRVESVACGEKKSHGLYFTIELLHFLNFCVWETICRLTGSRPSHFVLPQVIEMQMIQVCHIDSLCWLTMNPFLFFVNSIINACSESLDTYVQFVIAVSLLFFCFCDPVRHKCFVPIRKINI